MVPPFNNTWAGAQRACEFGVRRREEARIVLYDEMWVLRFRACICGMTFGAAPAMLIDMSGIRNG